MFLVIVIFCQFVFVIYTAIEKNHLCTALSIFVILSIFKFTSIFVTVLTITAICRLTKFIFVNSRTIITIPFTPTKICSFKRKSWTLTVSKTYSGTITFDLVWNSFRCCFILHTYVMEVASDYLSALNIQICNFWFLFYCLFRNHRFIISTSNMLYELVFSRW